MIKFFRKIRQNLIAKGNTGKYFKYAIGEIVLVVIGILIALQINNWNENRKTKAEVLDIYKQIVYDIDNTILQFSNWVEYYKNNKGIYDKVMSNTRTSDLLDDGLSRLMGGGTTTIFRSDGINRLKFISAKDSISLRLIDLDDFIRTQIHEIEKDIDDECEVLANTFRDNYDWYPEWIDKRITKDNSSKELQDYFVNSEEYRRYVVSSYNKIYNVYIPLLNEGIKEFEDIRNALKQRINKRNTSRE